MRAMTGGLVVLLLSGAAVAAPNEKLVEAQRLFDDLDLDGASKAVEEAMTQGSLEREALLKAYALQGLIRATLKQPLPARDAFYRLLLLDPGWSLPKNQPPRVKTPFFEAKGMATEYGPTTATPAFTSESGRVTGLTVTVAHDSLKLARAVAFTFTVDELEQTARVELQDGVATAPVTGQKVRWRALILADRDNVLLELGSTSEPLEATVSSAATSAVKPASEPARAAAGSWRRGTGIALLGVGAAAGITGVVLGARSEALRASVTGAARDDAGVVTGLSQREAFAVDADARGSAVAANVLFISAGVVAAAGLGLVLWSLAGDTVAVAPAPGGVVVSGSF